MKRRGKKLVVMIPCFNEEKTLPLVIKSIPRRIPRVSRIDILVINDGSTDKTGRIAKQMKVHLLTHVVNKGLGFSFRDGIEKALRLGADIIVNIDGDMQFDPRDIPKIISPITKLGANVATATRYKEYLDYNLKNRGLKNLGNKFFTGLINKITGKHFSDVSCGFRAYSREAAMKLQLFGHFTYTHEAFLDLVHKGFAIIEVPVKVEPNRLYGKSRISRNLVSYGYSALKIVVRGFRDHRPLDFFGTLGLFVISSGLIFGIILLYHWVTTGSVSPFKTYGFIGGFLIAIGFLVLVVALIADMIGRVRDLTEEIVYYLRDQSYSNKK